MTKNKIVTSLIVMTMVMFAMSMVSAADQELPLNVSLNLGNSDPTIISVTAPTPITLTGGATTAYNIIFVANDANGFADINLSTATAQLAKTPIGATATGCVEIVADRTATAVTLNCSFSLNYAQKAFSDYQPTVTIKDNSGVTATNNTAPQVTINELDYVEMSLTALAYNTVTLGTTDNQPVLNPSLTNLGNGQSYNISVKAYNVTNGIDTIPAEKFKVKLVLDATFTPLVDSTYTPTGTNKLISVVTLLNRVDLDLVLSPGTYTQTSPWQVKLVRVS